MISNILLAIFSAILSGLSIPNELFLYGMWPLGFISLCPLYIALEHAKSPREAALVAGIFGALQHAITSYWLFFYKDYAFWTLGTTTIAYFFIYQLAGLYAAFIIRSESKAMRPFAFAILWVCVEYIKSTGFLGYPWGLVPYSLTSIPVMLQIADITGVYGLSFLLALSSAILGEFLQRKNGISTISDTGHGTERILPDQKSSPDHGLRNGSIICAGLALIVFGYGLYCENKSYVPRDSIRMLLVQQNTDPWVSGENAALASNVALSREKIEENRSQGGAPIDMAIFSETSLRRPFAEFRPWFLENPKEDPLIPLLMSSDISLLTGAPVVLDWETYASTNSVILISRSGNLEASYAKIHPVPFAEAIPFWEYAWFRTFMRQTVGLEAGWVMGSTYTLFSIQPHSHPETSILFSTPICFEDAFPDLCRQYVLRGADLLVNLTNDSWSKTKSAQIQHWAIARIRAIENRCTLVRSTNSGVSCVIGARGEVIHEMPQFQACATIVDVPVFERDAMTIYTRFGDWFARLCFICLVLLCARDFVRARGNWPSGNQDSSCRTISLE
ncbi:MAG: apolipoprotein N-acyltransferase [Spirochaetaceae bacterium]|nr:apolipoprotein N-acyltransferase [Spirochaetaceae bacterium]